MWCPGWDRFTPARLRFVISVVFGCPTRSHLLRPVAQVVFQAGIDPTTRSNQLSEEQVDKLIERIPAILKIAIKCLGDPAPGASRGSTFPKDWLFKYNGGT